jgi:hypothetical protein
MIYLIKSLIVIVNKKINSPRIDPMLMKEKPYNSYSRIKQEINVSSGG